LWESEGIPCLLVDDVDVIGDDRFPVRNLRERGGEFVDRAAAMHLRRALNRGLLSDTLACLGSAGGSVSDGLGRKWDVQFGGRCMKVMGGQVPDRASPVTPNPCRS
jgi:hypothetical protein